MGSIPGRLQKLQKWAIRTITNSKYNAHTEPLLKQHRLLKISDLYHLSALKFYFKYQRDMLPKYFKDMFSSIQHDHNYDTRNRTKTHLRQANTASVSVSVRYNIPQIIQHIPSCILDKVSTHSLDGFSLYAKNHIISSYRFDCSKQNCYVCGQAE